jgi:hypothetical protein
MPPRSSSRPAPVPAKAPVPEPPKEPGILDLPAPSWTRWVIAILAAIMLVGLFTSESGDTDTWWHLKTGQYIVEQHKLPVPDPFAWTTYVGKDVYPGESVTRKFNLTHEWLAQVVMYLGYAAKGFTGMILIRGLFLTGLCALVGFIAYQRSRNFYRSFGAAIAIVFVMRNFVADRPQYFTYVFLAATILILESRKRLWLLLPLFVIWANCHAGFIMGWVVMGAYCGESLLSRLRGKIQPDERRLWTMCISAIVLSGLNPNIYNVIPVLRYYRASTLQSSIWEWQMPKYWEVSPFTILMYGAGALLLLNFRKTRPVDWILYGIFSISALMAMRNIFLVGIWAPVLIAAYAPRWQDWKKQPFQWMAVLAIAAAGSWYVGMLLSFLTVGAALVVLYLVAANRYPIVAVALIVLLLGNGLRYELSTKTGFQFRGAMWNYPVAATDFLIKHNIKGKMFNIYGQGGYLIWRLWPQLQVFTDGRALNESVYMDAVRIQGNASDIGGKSGEQLLKDYGIDVIVMQGFESVGGTAYYLAFALADPAQKEWKLVYKDVHDVIFMKNPPPDVPVLPSLEVLDAMEMQCAAFIQGRQPLCSRSLAEIFGKIGDAERFKKWKAIYEENRAIGEAAFTVVKK